MIDDSLIKSNFAGKDGFQWFLGRVAYPEAWKKESVIMSQSGSLGQRCKVRIIGYHPFSGTELPEEDLPWAQIMLDPVTGSGQGGMGDTAALVGGETCVGFFLDGDEAQQPVIIGLLHRSNSVENKIEKEELASAKSSYGRPFTGAQTDKATKSKRVLTENISSGNQGQVKSDTNPKTEQNETIEQGKSSNAARNLEAKSTKEERKPSTCSDDTIGNITQVLTDFIAFTNTLESALGNFIDPLTNKIVDIDYQISRIVKIVQGEIKRIFNNIKDGLISKLTFAFSTFLGNLNLINPLEFITDEATKLAFQKILDTIFCIFEKLFEDMASFLTNIFKTLVGNVVNGPLCAAEQFVSGMFSKVFEFLESSLDTILSGLDWLVGGFSDVQGVLRDVSSLATSILNFIGCDGKKCKTPSKWVSTLNGTLVSASNNWQSQLDSISVFDDIALDLREFGNDAEESIGDFFGSDEFVNTDYNGQRLTDVLSNVDKLTGGDSAGQLDRGLGSIESAIATSTLFGNNSIFNACNSRRDNPVSQSDLIPMPLGYVYNKEIPPEILIFSQTGSDASAVPVVGSDGSILSVDVTNGGSNYTSNTTAVLVDNTNRGTGATLNPIVKDGSVESIIVVRPGGGYTPGGPGVGITNPVGTITGIYINRPGIGYSDTDTGLIDGEYSFDIITTPNGSIVDTNIGSIVQQFGFLPDITINTNTGKGASLSPILTYRSQSNLAETDGRSSSLTSSLTSGLTSNLIGIVNVIDCVGNNDQVVGYVNGVPYSGPYHIMSNGLKMTGETHSASDLIIYDTVEESLRKSSEIVQPYSSDETVTDTVTETTTETTSAIVTTPSSSTTTPSTTQTTPDTSVDTTNTNTDTSTSTETDTGSSGGGGGGSYGGY